METRLKNNIMVCFIGSDSTNRYYKFDSVEQEKAFNDFFDHPSIPNYFKSI